jgi:beta-lactamase regulating signal transducer with metallopeptidase domain
MLDLVPLATPLSEGVIRWFVETTLVASVLALVALVCARVGRLGPSVRHALWLVVLIKLMMPPLIHWPWSLPWPQSLSNSSAPQSSASERPAAVRPVEEPTIPRDTNHRHLIESHATEFASYTTSLPDTIPVVTTAITQAPVVPPVTPLPGRFDSLTGVFRKMRQAVGNGLGVGIIAVWLVGSVAVGLAQARRIKRFCRLLSGAYPAPVWLVEEAQRIGRLMRVRVPEIRVITRPGTPMLWCLGRPVLLVPSDLLKSLESARWGGVLAHELAHIRRGDPWVRRLELAAGLVWWWNPLYWLARRRLDFEAELACDAWVLWALPKDRLDYAESLLRICSSLSLARSPTPALGVAGTGRSFERRLVMILRDRVSHHASKTGILAATLLAVVSLPSWTLAEPNRAEAVRASSTSSSPDPEIAPILIEHVAIVADDDDDDDDAPKTSKKQTATKTKKSETKTKAKATRKSDDPEARVREALGPDFEKRMEALGEKIGKEMELKFGPGSDFEKKMEAFGKEMEEKFGPEFEKKMEALGKEMEEKFGPEFQKKMEKFGKEMEGKFGPEFQKKMEAFGKEMEGKFGPGSDFTKEMTELGERLAKELGPGSEFADQMKDLEKLKAKAKDTAAKAKTQASQPKATRSPVAAKPKATASKQAKRIEALESQIEELMKELKKLKADGDEDEDR